MGNSVSINQIARLEAIKSNIENACVALPSKEDHVRLEKLRIDLVLYKEVREAFAEFIVWRADDTSEEVVDVIHNIDESYMDYLMLQGSVDDPRDSSTDLILFYLRIFAKSAAYDEVLTKESCHPPTPFTCMSEDEGGRSVKSSNSNRTFIGL